MLEWALIWALSNGCAAHWTRVLSAGDQFRVMKHLELEDQWTQFRAPSPGSSSSGPHQALGTLAATAGLKMASSYSNSISAFA